MKKKFLLIVCIIAGIIALWSWIYVSGSEIAFLKNVDDGYTARIYISETDISYELDKDIDTEASEVEISGEKAVQLAELLQENVRCRRRLERGLIRIPNDGSRKDISIIFTDQDSGDSELTFMLLKNRGVYIEGVSEGYLKNLNPELEELILNFLNEEQQI